VVNDFEMPSRDVTDEVAAGADTLPPPTIGPWEVLVLDG
jgi:hypothetical protein